MILQLAPDPPKDEGNENIESSIVAPFAAGLGTVDGSSSDEEEDHANAGYELLPQAFVDEEEEDNDEDGDDDDVPNGDANVHHVGDASETQSREASAPRLPSQMSASHSLASEALTNFTREEQREMAQTWKDNNRREPVAMDPEHAEIVKAAMAGFSLPASSIPLWATAVPEEEWKTQLVERLRKKQPDSLKKDVENAER